MSATAPAATLHPRPWRELLEPVAQARLALVAGLMLLTYWDVIRHTLVARWINDGDWSHCWLIPLFSLYSLHARREELGRVQARPSYWGAAVLALSLGLYFFSAWRLSMRYPQALTIVGAIFGATLLLGGWSVVRLAWFPIAFLLLAIPLPESVYVALTQPQQVIASKAAAAVMPLFAPGLYTEAQAVVIDYLLPGRPPSQLNVAEACSGMRSMMAILTLGVAMAYVDDRPAWQRLVMILFCIPIAILCNTIRVTITGLLVIYGHDDWARGTPHLVLGMLMFAVALGLYSLIGYVLSRLWVEDTTEGQEA
ncbi:MAG: exosortase/archaeosortase family protein [Planctomycetes bacterium]|nr:exosortase/archaeosortase family protein [Planctomycetota bacterium]